MGEAAEISVEFNSVQVVVHAEFFLKNAKNFFLLSFIKKKYICFFIFWKIIFFIGIPDILADVSTHINEIK